jgi:hypothetical protein
MNLKTRVFAGLIAASAVVGVAGITAGAASAAPLKVAVGSVELSSPLQYTKFVAIQHAGSHGAIDYTNFTYGENGSGVWAPAGETLPAQTTLPDNALTFSNGTAYVHTLNGGLHLTATSTDQLSFTGTGKYSGSSQTWKITGKIKDSKVTFEIKYDGSTYVVDAAGTIASNGSASGTAKGSDGQNLTWTMPAGAFVQVLHIKAPVSHVKVNLGARNASFRWTVPASGPFAVPAPLGGTIVVSQVHDGNLPGNGGDTYSHGVLGGAQQNYPVTGGPGIYIP